MIRLPGFGRQRGQKSDEAGEPEESAAPNSPARAIQEGLKHALEPGRDGFADDLDAVAPDEDLSAEGFSAETLGDEGVREADPSHDAAEPVRRASGFEAPSLEDQMRMIEAMLFAANQPMSVAELAERMPVGSDAAHAVRELEARYAARGVQLVRVAGKWAFRTAPDLAFLMRGEVVEQRRLSKAAIETLAVIAYHQPVTRAEIEEIRQVGVSKGTVDLLMELDWVKLGRRRQTPGRPVTFVTTDHFLQKFSLDSLRDLPGLDELRQAGLLDRRPPTGGAPLGATESDAEEALDDDEALAAEGEDIEDDEAERRRQEEMTM